MQIYILRHGEAKPFAATDEERPLTEHGRVQTAMIAEWLQGQLTQPLDTVIVSPYVRAQQTWDVMGEYISPASNVVTDEGITPYGDGEDVADYLRAKISVERPESILLVSHLPLVGYLTSELVLGIQPPVFSTSAVACVEYDPDTERGRLLWLQSPNRLPTAN
ncbi:phosphohistidine phosphatase SixA [Veronia nyctiphanis]|uniref:Phosphohistidine phosphatase SixA n=1 Tax=Veronia nyctiphanis TaxID=1278244 RepID=A0A4Q0YV00_9GAMM|nr:phosphohistidine phosphatase SixA [Veronia nyctiphanis]RXJ72949.1 phosphohistidine phosphatase SixA [Veronia nyctiphanis]